MLESTIRSNQLCLPSLLQTASCVIPLFFASCEKKTPSATTRTEPAEVHPSVLPTQWILEAEDQPKGEVKQDATAHGGAYVYAQNGSYQEVFAAAMPEATVLPAEVTVSVLRRGGPVQLKSVTGNQQKDIEWSWGECEDFEWRSLGRHPLEQLGERLVLIRGENGKPVEIDAVVLSAEPSPNLGSLMPPLPSTKISVDWTHAVGEVTSDHFGINGFSMVDPLIGQNPEYQKNLRAINPGILRIHSAELHGSSSNKSGWVDEKNRCWDRRRVLAALAPVRNLPLRTMPCISSWPEWMDANHDGMLDSDQFDAFAAFCADLVRLVNADASQAPVLWWEVTNEKDDRYFTHLRDAKVPDRLDELAKIYRLAAAAMKAADSRIRVGGPSALNSYNMDFHDRFIKATADALDFYSVHLYVSGNKGDSDASVFKRADSPFQPMKMLVQALHQASPDRKIELILNEYNISWDWQQRDPRMVDWRGAVWDAWFIVQAIKGGVDGLAGWNDSDGIYGKMSPDFKLRPSGESLALLNRKMIGSRYECTLTPDAGSGPLNAMAIRVKDGTQRLLVINRGSRPSPLTLRFKFAVLMDSSGSRPLQTSSEPTVLPPLSYAIFEM